eukprot:291266_1
MKHKSVSDIVSSLQNNKLCWTLNIVGDKATNDKPKECSSILNDADAAKIGTILSNNKIAVNSASLALAFRKHGYDKQQLIDDLCDSTFHLSEDQPNTILCQILNNNFQINDLLKQQDIHEILLYQYIQLADLNHSNFIKSLEFVAHGFYTPSECQQIINIAKQEPLLTGKIFIKS